MCIMGVFISKYSLVCMVDHRPYIVLHRAIVVVNQGGGVKNTYGFRGKNIVVYFFEESQSGFVSCLKHSAVSMCFSSNFCFTVLFRSGFI